MKAPARIRYASAGAWAAVVLFCVVGLSLLQEWHAHRPPWQVPTSEHPKLADYRRLREQRDRFYAEVAAPSQLSGDHAEAGPY